MHFFARGLREQRQTAYCELAISGGQLQDHGFDAFGIENGLSIPQSGSIAGEPEVNDPTVGGISRSGHVSSTHQAIDAQRHRRCADTHMSGQPHQACRLGIVEVIEDSGLICADHFACFRVTNMSRVTRVENPGVELQYLTHYLLVSHQRQSSEDSLLCQNKLFYCSALPRNIRQRARCADRKDSSRLSFSPSVFIFLATFQLSEVG